MPGKVSPYTIQVITKPPRNRVCAILGFTAGLAIGTLGVLVITYAYLIPEAEKSCIPPVNGAWADWGDWGSCIQSCNTKEQFESRNRTCTNPAPAGGGATCAGNKYEHRDCSGAVYCSTVGGWAWSDWGTCSTSCGDGNSTRTRECSEFVPKDDAPCKRSESENKACKGACSGQWNEWTQWACNVTCGQGQQSRTRTCTVAGACTGESYEADVCDTGKVCLDNSKYSEWGAWVCNVTCGVGFQTRSRTCTSDNNTGCEGPSTETQPCDTGKNCTTKCPAEYTTVSTYCFRSFMEGSLSWSEAVAKCKESNGNLFLVTDEPKLEAVKTYVTDTLKSTTLFWINGQSDGTTNVFKTSDGQEIKLRYWMDGEPNDFDTSVACIQINPGNNFLWSDKPCTETAPFICETDPTTDQTTDPTTTLSTTAASTTNASNTTEPTNG